MIDERLSASKPALTKCGVQYAQSTPSFLMTTRGCSKLFAVLVAHPTASYSRFLDRLILILQRSGSLFVLGAVLTILGTRPLQRTPKGVILFLPLRI